MIERQQQQEERRDQRRHLCLKLESSSVVAVPYNRIFMCPDVSPGHITKERRADKSQATCRKSKVCGARKFRFFVRPQFPYKIRSVSCGQIRRGLHSRNPGGCDAKIFQRHSLNWKALTEHSETSDLC